MCSIPSAGGTRLVDQAPQRAGNGGQLIGYEGARALRLIRDPIADHKSAKNCEIQAMTGRRQNLATKLPQEKMGAAKAVFAHAFGAPPLNRVPMQEVVGPQPKRVLQGTVRRIFHYTVGKEANHHAGYDFSFITGDQKQSILGQREGTA